MLVGNTDKPKLGIVRPSVSTGGGRDSRVQRAALRIETGEARLVVMMTPDKHQALKAHAATRGQSIKDYVMAVLTEAGAFADE